MNYYLGIDFGTSGARAVVIDEQKIIAAETKDDFVQGNCLIKTWQKVLYNLIEKIPKYIRKQIKAMAINGTSATVLLCDAQGNPLHEPILYNDSRGKVVLQDLKEIVPSNHLVLSASSSLAKLYWWYQQPIFAQAAYFLHQADWLAFLLHGKLGLSDYHNALKLGYDVENLTYPNWLKKLPFFSLLPQIFAPGTPVGEINQEIGDRFDLPKDCLVKTGTTDSIAAFLASGVTQPGEAVTSVGSTLVLKLLSNTRIEDSLHGIYSHKLGDLWLTGGASNTGGAVLRHFFSDAELEHLSSKINPNLASPLNYYPLLKPGDRFPINEPNLPPQLEPRPEEAADFLHGLLESIAKIEARGYKLLQQLGATNLTKVYTAGGGAKNAIWNQIRQRHLQVPVVKSQQTEAAYGTAVLASKNI
jgi:sugar (pentulose or hexulose) kinase